MSNLVGAPPFYKTAEELQEKIAEFINNPPTRYVNRDGEKVEVPVLTISGLCYFLGFADRRSFYDYELKPEFTHTIKRARLFIECEYEKLLHSNNVTGAIFALKNFGWRDSSNVDVTTNGKDMQTSITFVANNEDRAG